MVVQINDFMSTVRAVDSDSLLAPQTMEKIVRVVLQAVNDQEAHSQRVRAERRISLRDHQTHPPTLSTGLHRVGQLNVENPALQRA